MKTSSRRYGRRTATAGAVLLALTLPLGATTLLPAASAAPLGQEYADALDQTTGGITGLELTGDPRSVVVLDKSFQGFPTSGGTALILSTGDASVVADKKAAKGTPKTQHGDDAGTILDTATKSVDGNDQTQVAVQLDPPAGSGCVGFDFMFLTEEFPRYKGQEFNDVFTAELGTSNLSLNGTDVEAPNNFAFSGDQEVLSLNAFSKFVKAQESSLNGRSEIYSATSPLDPANPQTTLFLTVQDLGDSYLDSAVVVDNLRYLDGTQCAAGTVPLTDTDGDGLPDTWETEGIDLDGDGIPELDLPAMGADPLRKDIFVEIDWMNADPACTTTRLLCAVENKRNKTPHPEAIKRVVEAFKNAPVSNPDGSTGITLHVDAGPDSPKADGTVWGALSRGNQIPFKESLGSASGPWQYDWTEFEELRKQHSDPIRNSVFRYAIWGHGYPTGDPGLVESSGLADIKGTRLMVTNHDWSYWPIESEAGTFMHELGHNLGLEHGGDDGVNSKEGYYSVMNYDFQMPGVDLAGKLDYSTGRNDYKLSFDKLDPKAHGSKGTAVPPLHTFDDWSYLTYTGWNGQIGSLGPGGSAAEPEAPKAEANFEDSVKAEGAGGILVLGPTLLAKDVADQVILADVTNHSGVEATYTISIDTDWQPQPMQVTVPAETTQRVAIPVTVDAASAEAVPFTASLTYDGNLMATSRPAEANLVDLTDSATEAEVKETMEELLSDPVPGLEADVLEVLDAGVAAAVGVDLSGAETAAPETEQDDDSSLPLPLWALGLIVVAVLMIGGLAVTRLRKRS